jgi:asparagine synthase (glutamine-hydrolysing)
MCGITFIHSKQDINEIDLNSVKGKIYARGPDDTKHLIYKNKYYFGFDRLIINDDSKAGMQPFVENGVRLICNGEIFNWKKLNKTFDLKMSTSCDCEVILKLYLHYKILFGNDTKRIGIHLCSALDGEFAFVLYDENANITLASRDAYGVRPLFYGENDNLYTFCSELKGISNISKTVEQFKPGHIMINGFNNYTKYSDVISNYKVDQLSLLGEETYLSQINHSLRNAVKKRLMSDKEICCLLSGGLDSSLIAALVAEHFEPYTLKTFSIGLKGSTDLMYAKVVADHIKSIHTNIELSEQDFLNAIETVIETIETYDTTTVRASVGNYLVAKYIKEHSDCKVVFNGDFSDEVTGGYKYMALCDDEIEFHSECIRLINDIHYFDGLRSDRCLAAHGLEARVPFADTSFVHSYLRIPIEYRMSNNRIEKYMLRKAFAKDCIIPHDVLWRKKEAFSDGVSSKENSWHSIIKRYIDDKISDEDFNMMKADIINPVQLKETAFYKIIFKKFYSDFTSIIPYFWLPKYCGNIIDPSAREI